MKTEPNITAIRHSFAYHAATILIEQMPEARGRTARTGVGSVALLLQQTLAAMARGRPTLTAAAETDEVDFGDAVTVALADLGFELRNISQECDRDRRKLATNIKESVLWRRLREARLLGGRGRDRT